MDNRVRDLIVDNLVSLSESTKFVYDVVRKDGSSIMDFVTMKSLIFENNLRLLDSYLPEIIAWMLADCYLSQDMSIKSCVNRISDVNPMKYPAKRAYDFYSYKIRRALLGFVEGVSPEIPWELQYRKFAWLIIRSDKETVRFSRFEENAIVEYLYDNTKFEIFENESIGTNGNEKRYKELSFSIGF